MIVASGSPYEILKGKLLGQIDKVELDGGKFNERWEEQLRKVNAFADDDRQIFQVLVESQVRGYTQGRPAIRRGLSPRDLQVGPQRANRFDHDAGECESVPGRFVPLLHSLYARIWDAAQVETPAFPAIFFNRLNELDSQFLVDPVRVQSG